MTGKDHFIELRKHSGMVNIKFNFMLCVFEGGGGTSIWDFYFGVGGNLLFSKALLVP